MWFVNRPKRISETSLGKEILLADFRPSKEKQISQEQTNLIDKDNLALCFSNHKLEAPM